MSANEKKDSLYCMFQGAWFEIFAGRVYSQCLLDISQLIIKLIKLQ